MHYNATDEPPSYKDATDPNADPPTYETLYGEFRQLRDPKSFGYFVRKFVGFVLGSVVFLVLLFFQTIVPLAMIIVGSIYINDCTIERRIPVYLIVGGVMGLFKSMSNVFFRAMLKRRHRNAGTVPSPEENINPNPFEGLLNTFLFIWFLVGSYWVYGTDPEFDNPKKWNYCNEVVFWFAYWTVTVQYISIMFLLCFLCCCGCCVMYFNEQNRDNYEGM